MNNIKFSHYTTEYISGVMSLRTPQKRSLEILADIVNEIKLKNRSKDLITALSDIRNKYPTCTDFEKDFISLTFALATGVGKTRLMGAFISYLYTRYNIKNFFVVAPTTIDTVTNTIKNLWILDTYPSNNTHGKLAIMTYVDPQTGVNYIIVKDRGNDATSVTITPRLTKEGTLYITERK